MRVAVEMIGFFEVFDPVPMYDVLYKRHKFLNLQVIIGTVSFINNKPIGYCIVTDFVTQMSQPIL